MRTGRRSIGLLSFLLWSTASLASATIINGDFTTALSGWSTTDTTSTGQTTSPSRSVAESGGEAVLRTQGFLADVALVSLFQDITLPALTTTLSLDIGLAQTGSDTPPGTFGFLDVVQVSYLDATDTAFDRLWLGVNVAGAFEPTTRAPLILPDLGNGLRHFTTDVTSLAGRTGTLFIDLADQDDGFFSQARLDNVALATRPSTVPEPGTWLLLSSGCLAVLWARRGFRRP